MVASLNDTSFLGQCSVLSELSVITFDGNNIALCNMASYVLVKLPGEIIVAHIEKCPANQVRNLHFLGNCSSAWNYCVRGITVDKNALVSKNSSLEDTLCKLFFIIYKKYIEFNYFYISFIRKAVVEKRLNTKKTLTLSE